MNVEIGAEAAKFPEKEYINGIAFQCITRGMEPTKTRLYVKGFYYIEYQSFCPVVCIGPPPSLPRKLVCQPPPPPRTHLCVATSKQNMNSGQKSDSWRSKP
jgi:hypothetical protein